MFGLSCNVQVDCSDTQLDPSSVSSAGHPHWFGRSTSTWFDVQYCGFEFEHVLIGVPSVQVACMHRSWLFGSCICPCGQPHSEALLISFPSKQKFGVFDEQ